MAGPALPVEPFAPFAKHKTVFDFERSRGAFLSFFSDFRKAGHPPTLLSAFLYFDVSFMVWVILGPLGPFIGEAYHLSATQKGLLTAVPLLGGSFFRPILGWMTERFGGRRTGLIGMALTLIPLVMGWQLANSFCRIPGDWFAARNRRRKFCGRTAAGKRLVSAGASGPGDGHRGRRQFGHTAGHSVCAAAGAGFWLAQRVWLGSDPHCAGVDGLFLSGQRFSGAATREELGEYASLFKLPDTWWFCFLYSLTFGGFVGLASYLSIFFHDQYHLTKVQAGDFTTVVVLFGSFLRPVGGVLSDRLGGYRMLLTLLCAAALMLAGVATLPPAFVALFLLLRQWVRWAWVTDRCFNWCRSDLRIASAS